MGQVFVTRQPLEQVPILDYAGLGREALEISREEFKARLKLFRGEIKGILTRGDFVAGIGNAYADEVLRTAKIHRYRKKISLTLEEVDRLCDGARVPAGRHRESARADGRGHPSETAAVETNQVRYVIG